MSGTNFEPNIWQIIRSSQKDKGFIDKLAADLDLSIKHLFGVRFWIRTKDLVYNSNKLFYYLLTSFSGSQTLGEEYCHLLQITDNHSVPSRTKSLTLSLLYAFQHALLDKLITALHNFSRKYFDYNCLLDELRKDVHYIVHLLQALNLTTFYFNGTYLDLVKRLLGIRYLSTYQRSLSDANQSTSKLLGCFSLLQILLSLYSKYNSLRHNPNYEQPIRSAELFNSPETNPKCLLCFSSRTNPTLIECGHIFCWHCLTKWLQYKDSCPTCRRSVKSNRLVYLHNYD